jgi:exopolyphosphatase/guanosine-5'-triphosphate,3'-diphosphate pyrophosphatase
MIYTKDSKPMEFAKLKKMHAYLSSYSLEDRIKVLGLNPDRADVIIPASEIYLTLMRWTHIRQLIVPRLGLVDGIIQQLIEKNYRKG